MTMMTAVLCGATFLPSELLLHQWQHGTDEEYSFYSMSWSYVGCVANIVTGGMITGNYGLWNMYVISTLILYLPKSEGL